jgi:hypothetical protein
MKNKDLEFISELTEAALEMTADYEAKNHITSYSLCVKRPNRGPWHLSGNFTNFFIDKAFDEKNKDNKDAIKAVKDQLWYSFRKCYFGE